MFVTKKGEIFGKANDHKHYVHQLKWSCIKGFWPLPCPMVGRDSPSTSILCSFFNFCKKVQWLSLTMSYSSMTITNHATDMVHIFICLELPHSVCCNNTYMLWTFCPCPQSSLQGLKAIWYPAWVDWIVACLPSENSCFPGREAVCSSDWLGFFFSWSLLLKVGNFFFRNTMTPCCCVCVKDWKLHWRHGDGFLYIWSSCVGSITGKVPSRIEVIAVV